MFGLYLFLILFGLWWNFGDNILFDNQCVLLCYVFDCGIMYFDFVNNYGLFYGLVEKNFGCIFVEDLCFYCDELIILLKVGWDMWFGLYGDFVSCKYIFVSVEQLLMWMGFDYVDIFYFYCVDLVILIVEIVGVFDMFVCQGKVFYVGIFLYSVECIVEVVVVVKDFGMLFVIYQLVYLILNCWIEDGLIDIFEQLGFGVIVFILFVQGFFMDKYFGDGMVEWVQKCGFFLDGKFIDEVVQILCGFNEVVQGCGQFLVQFVLQWMLCSLVVVLVLIGVLCLEQFDENIVVVNGFFFMMEEFVRIDELFGGIDVNLWVKFLEL